MAFERSPLIIALVLCGCASPARFPLREPLLRDPDQVPVLAVPEESYSPFAWDGANQTVFRPLSRFFAVDPAGPAVNVNALDEVPDSSWFENRLGKRQLSPAEVARGACAEHELDPGAPDGTWLIDKGKDNGANPGFRISVPRLGKFMLKSDPSEEPDRATGATSVASRVYHALGYYAPCDSVVYFRPALLKLKPGLTVTNNEGVTKPFDEARLKDLLAHASHRNGLVRMVASEWLPGKPIGPYKYDGLRSDDPNDVIPHEDRRELRGGRLVAAWLAHFDSREQNTMDVFLPADPAKKNGPGYVRHYIIDLGDCFGSVWSDDRISRRLNHAYALDFPYLAEDFVTLGMIERPWERAQKGALFGYFSARDFDPELWRGEYPNPAFGRMTEGDGAWMARILARFDEGLVRAAVAIGKYEPANERYLAETLIARRMAILRRYLARVSPIGEVKASAHGFCGVDLARLTGVVPNESTSFRARAYRGAELEPTRALRLRSDATPRVCVELPHAELSPSLPADDARRYVIVDLENGYAPGPLRAHLYDLGPGRGYRLVGIERPEQSRRP
ncbi:MAG TPA: hypothetical protein VJV79_00555 [Polyangiaceae bacterium]|nr:hypothetical protein [Polyangiaceae bacterium]